MSQNKETQDLSKESRIVLFLQEAKNKPASEIKRLYLEKYQLSERSAEINLRIFQRFFGEYSKYSPEKKEARVKEVTQKLKEIKVNYNDLLQSFKEIKEKTKRSNRLNNFLEIKISE